MPKPHITLTPLSAFRPRRRTSFLIWEHSSLTLIHYSKSQVRFDRHSPSLPVRPGNLLKIVPGNLPDGKENNLKTIPYIMPLQYLSYSNRSRQYSINTFASSRCHHLPGVSLEGRRDHQKICGLEILYPHITGLLVSIAPNLIENHFSQRELQTLPEHQ